MKKNEEITKLSEEIMVDITDSRLPLHNILLKSSRLSLLLDLAENVKLFKDWSKYAEQNQFIVSAFQISMQAAQDRNVSITSSNPHQMVTAPWGNLLERSGIKDRTEKTVGMLSYYRSETYNFALGIHQKWQFGNIAESIFEKKRKKVEPLLREVFPDANQRLNSIEQNLNTTNSEDWKNAIASCRTLLMDFADVLNPPKTKDEKGKYINRLKDFVSPLVESETKNKLLKTHFDEIKKRIEYTSNLTQGGAHTDRPTREQAEDVVLYTYLIVAELLNIYKEDNENTS